MAFTSIIDDEALFVLSNHQRRNELRELTRIQKETRVLRAMCAAARHEIEMRSGERLVHEDTARHQQICERLKQRPIEVTHADDQIDRFFPNGQCSGLGHDADYSLMTSDGGNHGSMNDIHENDHSSSLRERRSVASSASGDVEDPRVRWQREASFDDPGRRSLARVDTLLAVPRFPARAIVSRPGLVTHQ